MDITTVWEQLIRHEGGKIIYLILDGVGGLPVREKGGTELQVANIPHLDQLAKNSSCGLLEVVGPGITPGSGPGHLALFGYDPLKYRLGRGILSALGIGFALQTGDVAARVNFATIDAQGNITDRRAGRISTQTNRALCEKIRKRVTLNFEGEYFLETVSEHRAVFMLRGPGLSGDLSDTDPQRTGLPPADPQARSEEGRRTADLVRSFVEQAREILSAEEQANMILLRGFDSYHPYPSLKDRFGLQGVCLADYPMYRGVSRLLGLDILPSPGNLEERFRQLQACYREKYDFYFLHVKHTDSHGEDRNFDAKVAVLEAVDTLIPHIINVQPDVLVVTADHSTPASMGMHSWHPVPVMISAQTARSGDVESFDEYACARGSLGLRPTLHLMGLALAHAGRLQKYGA